MHASHSRRFSTPGRAAEPAPRTLRRLSGAVFFLCPGGDEQRDDALVRAVSCHGEGRASVRACELHVSTHLQKPPGDLEVPPPTHVHQRRPPLGGARVHAARQRVQQRGSHARVTSPYRQVQRQLPLRVRAARRRSARSLQQRLHRGQVPPLCGQVQRAGIALTRWRLPARRRQQQAHAACVAVLARHVERRQGVLWTGRAAG